MIIYAELKSSRVRHQYGIFGGKSQTSFLRNATRAGSEEGRLFSQAKYFTSRTDVFLKSQLFLKSILNLARFDTKFFAVRKILLSGL